MWVFCGWSTYAGRPRDAAARRPDHHRRDQARSRAPPPLAEPVRGPGVLPRDGAPGGRARPPAAPAWPGSPPHAPLGGALSASQRATALFPPAASIGAQECPFQAKNQRRCTGGAPKLRIAAVRRSSRGLFCGSSLTRSCNRRPQRRTRWAQAADHRGTWRWRTAPRCAHAVPRWQCARALMPRQCCASSRLRRRRLRSLETSRH